MGEGYGRDADTEAGPWLGDTPGFNNHFIPCTRDSGRDWAGVERVQSYTQGSGAGKRDRKIYIYIDTLI